MTDPKAVPANILVVDDDPEMTDMLETVLTDAGYEVACAASGAEALSAIERRSPDLVLTDLSMPEMNGLDLVQTARALRPDVPVIVLTAFGDWPSFCRAQDLKVDRYLSKPVPMEELLQDISELLGTSPDPTNPTEGD